ncbi:MAG: hypothetical protein WBM44_25570 [Waterburya sp.]
MSQQFPLVFVRQEDFQLSQDETMGTKSKFWFNSILQFLKFILRNRSLSHEKAIAS